MTEKNQPSKVRGSKKPTLPTQERLLIAAQEEFARHGYGGARVDRICKSAKANIRMLYHYFGGKEQLYTATLEATYRKIRDLEQEMVVREVPADVGMTNLINLTFDYLATDPLFVRIMMNENLMMGKVSRKSVVIPELSQPLIETVGFLLKKGRAEGIFQNEVSATHLYITILGLCFIHVSNRHTLGHMLQLDLTEPEWLAERKRVVRDVVIAHLTTRTSMSEER